MLNKIKNKNQRGFTMLEMIIVVFLVSFSLVAIYGAFSVLILLNTDSIDRLKATYLAQEGLEIVRNIRDANWNREAPWLTGLETCTTACQVDYKTNGISNLPTSWDGVGDFLATDNGFYKYSPSPVHPSKFTRKITINIIDSHSVIVFSEVMYNSRPIFNLPQAQSVRVEIILYDWK